MNANAKKWVEALRGGRFKQAKEQLRDGETDRFCCLGVACEVYRQETGQGVWDTGGTFSVDEDEDGSTLLPAVRQWLGLQGDGGEMYQAPALYELNDEGKRFKTIAKIIESEPPGLFA